MNPNISVDFYTRGLLCTLAVVSHSSPHSVGTSSPHGASDIQCPCTVRFYLSLGPPSN